MPSYRLIRIPEKWFKWRGFNEGTTCKSASKVNATNSVLRRRWLDISNIWNPFGLLVGAIVRGTKLLLEMWFPNRKGLRSALLKDIFFPGEEYFDTLLLSTYLLSVSPIGQILGETSGQGNLDGALSEGYPPGAWDRVEKDEDYMGEGKWKITTQQVTLLYSPVWELLLQIVGGPGCSEDHIIM